MSMDSVSQRVATAPPPPKSAEAAGKRLNLKSGSESLREMDESKIRKNMEERRLKQKKSGSKKSVHDMDENEIRELYDDRETPFCYICDRFHYRNKAQIRLDEEIKKAMDEYRRQRALLPPGPYHAIDPPAIARLCGGVRPLTITDENRDRLIRFCNLALDKFNAENENQGEIFVFHDLVKSTRRLVAGYMYYITFQAKVSRPKCGIGCPVKAPLWSSRVP